MRGAISQKPAEANEYHMGSGREIPNITVSSGP